MDNATSKFFAEMIMRGHEIRADAEIRRREKQAADIRNVEMEKKFAAWSDDDLIKHWDTVGCDFNCSVVCCEDVHWELNRRGRGDACAV